MCQAIGVKPKEEINGAKEKASEIFENLYYSMRALSDGSVILYDVIKDYFFQDAHYEMLVSNAPMWMAEAGRSLECRIDKVWYDKNRQKYNDPMSHRVLHWFDVQNILAAFQDRVWAIGDYLKEIFKEIPAYCLYKDWEYTDASRVLNDRSDRVHTNINNVFVSLSSAFDLFTKVVYECAKYNPNDFATYNRLKSRRNSILYDKKNYGFNELKEPGLLYSEPACIRTICSFRDEFIHCGAWDYRCAIYYPSINGEPVEPFIPMPDVEPSGVLVSSGSRNKFYASGAKINTVLPTLVKDVLEVLSKTVDKFQGVLEKNTDPLPEPEREKNATRYIALLTTNISISVFNNQKPPPANGRQDGPSSAI